MTSLSSESAPDAEILDALARSGLLADVREARFESMTGGVSSDIWKIQTDERVFCVKRARSRLKVEMDWRAPIERNRFEVAWYEIADRIVPGAAPRVLGHDPDAMLCFMEYLAPSTHRLWKSELRAGRTDQIQAAEAGRRLARIHSATVGDASVAGRFPRSNIFHAIRLEPYLEATAARHPDLREALFALSRRTAGNRIAMIHGDVSPKNILIGPNGPVFLDAECACIGDPAFDLAFCLNHFLLKCLWTPAARDGFLRCFQAMADTYLDGADWEPTAALEARAASLLPGLLLARVDGKSPVEYLSDESGRRKVRRCGRGLVADPPARLEIVLGAWQEELSS